MAEYLSTHTGLRVDEAIAKIPDGNPGAKSVIVVNTNGKPEYASATTEVAPNTIPIRDTVGRIQAAAPVDVNDVTNKQYTDDNFVKAINVTAGDYVYAAIVNNPNDKRLIDIGTTANTIAQRTADGRLRTAEPVENTDAVNKQYFDTNISTFSVEVW